MDPVDPTKEQKAEEQLQEKQVHLRTQLTQRKSVIVRYLNRIDRAIPEQRIDELKSLLPKMMAIFDELDEIFYELKVLDLEETTFNDAWFENLQQRYIIGVKSIHAFLSTDSSKLTPKLEVVDPPPKPVSVPPKAPVPASSNSVGSADIAAAMSLPKVEIQPFDGNPLEYHAFVNAFKTNVDSQCVSADAKIARLLYYTRGVANEAIKGFQIKGGEDNYRLALERLEDAFGSDQLVTQCMIEKLTSKKAISGPKEMRCFGYELSNALLVLGDLKTLHEIDAQIILKKIIARVPGWVQGRWDKRQLKSKRLTKSYLKFKDLAEFINEVADELNDPLCGKAMSSENKQKAFLVQAGNESPSSSGSPSAQRKKSAEQKSKGNFTHDRTPCIRCQGNHALTRCDTFKTMTVKERKLFAQQKKLCFNCLREGHSADKCSSQNACLVCKAKHSAFLHFDREANCLTVPTHNASFMPVVRVVVNDKIEGRAALDTCSSCTFCTRELANRLSLSGTETCFKVDTMCGPGVISSQTVSFSISSGDESMHITAAKIVDRIPIACDYLDVKQYQHLRDLDVSGNIDCACVDILIGQDNAEALVPLEVRKGGPPYAVRYKFGWALSGRAAAPFVSNATSVCNFISTCVLDENNRDSVDAWSLAHLDRDEAPSMSLEDQKVITLWDDEARKEDQHYELPIPWKDRSDPLPNNYVVAKRRLDSLLKRIEAARVVDRYQAEIDKLLEAGFAEVITDDELRNPRYDRIFYIPHHNVLNPNKPDKFRIVFDCACPFQGQSLNQRCMQGPNLINSLFNILVKFRNGRFALQADVRAMYNQVRVPVADRDALRFLWSVQGKVVHMRMKSHLFGGIWCSAASTYALRRTVIDHPNPHPLVVKAIMKCTYVDDCLVSVNSRDDIELLLGELPKTMITGGFPLTKFVVNDPSLIELIPEEDRAKEVREFGPESAGRALGVAWNIQDDVFKFAVRDLDLGNGLTRKAMLKITASIFDPLGLVLPWIMPGKLIFQRATELKVDWDQEVPPDLRERWDSWVSGLSQLQKFTIPRCMHPFSPHESYCEIHVFCDASQEAYGACAYLRCVNIEGAITCNLICAKGFVAPLQRQTIPRLELQAAVKAVKLGNAVHNNLECADTGVPVYFWTDSMIVLGYIANETRRFKVFVANRVSVIRSMSRPAQWRHVGSKENPADCLTKSSPHVEKLWSRGPDFLLEANALWRDANCDAIDLGLVLDDDDVEVAHVACNVIDTAALCNPIEAICEHYSSWTSMYRALAWLQRLAECFGKSSGTQPNPPHLTTYELRRAQRCIITHVQLICYGKEVDLLSRGKALGKGSGIRSLSPFLDSDGSLRVGGRTNRNPYLLPHDHSLAEKIVRHYHSISHVGVEWTLSLLRAHFWLTKPRRVIRRVIRGCVKCRRFFAKPASQIMADLPPERITPNAPPFTFVGLDAFGPFDVTIRRSTVKRYGCIFTCMTSRAIHIEVLHSLDVHSFINSFRRFISRRGAPSKVYSDNGTNFVAGERELNNALKVHSRTALPQYASKQHIEWSFNPPGAPHMGGAWERLIGVVKRILKSILIKATRLNDEILETVLCEAESIINGRPLTKLSDNPDDLGALTPNHLLMLRENVETPLSGNPSDAYRCRWKHTQHLVGQFWQRWIREYLPLLQKRVKWQDASTDLSVGELVILAEKGLPRCVWPLSRVTEISRGRDGRVRSVLVKTRTSILRRPITSCVRLELDAK